MSRTPSIIFQIVAGIGIAVAIFAAIWGLGTLLTNAEKNRTERQQRIGHTEGYAEGYCTALGGTVLNADTCNVEGKVVAIVR